MKNLQQILFVCMALLISNNSFAQQANYVGHVTLLKRTASMIYLGGGTATPSSDAKDLGFGNPFYLNAGLYQSFWQKNNFGIGIHAFGEFGFGNGSIKPYPEFPIAGFTSSVTNTGTPKFTGFSAGVGPQFNFGLGENVLLSPILDFAYVNQKLDAFSVNQTYNSGGTSKDFSLYSQPEIETSGLGIIPRLRFHYFFTKNIGVWFEGNYSILPEIKTSHSTFSPSGNPAQGGLYNIDQINSGTTTTQEVALNNSGVGFGGGIVISLGKPKDDVEVEKPNNSANSNIDIPEENNIPEKYQAIIDEQDRKQTQNSCTAEIIYPANEGMLNSNVKAEIKVNYPTNYIGDKGVRIYKISGDKNFMDKQSVAEKAKFKNAVVLEQKFAKNEQIPIKNNTIEKGKLSEGTYAMFAGKGGCSSTPVIFKAASCFPNVSVASSRITCKDNGKIQFSGVVTNTTPANGATIISITFDVIENITDGTVVTPTSFSPTVIPVGNATTSFTFEANKINCKKIKVKFKIVWKDCDGNTFTNYCNVEETMPCCICNPCEKNPVKVETGTIKILDNTLGTIQLTNKVTSSNTIVKIQANIVAVKINSLNNDCVKCNTSIKTQDNFVDKNQIINSAGWVNSGNPTKYGGENSDRRVTRGLTFTTTSAAGLNLSSGANFSHTIGIAPTSCCGDTVEIWIRYTVWGKDCKVCDQLVRHVLKREPVCTNTGTGTSGPSDQQNTPNTNNF